MASIAFATLATYYGKTNKLGGDIQNLIFLQTPNTIVMFNINEEDKDAYVINSTSHLGLTPHRWWEEEALVVEAGKLEGDMGMRV